MDHIFSKPYDFEEAYKKGMSVVDGQALLELTNPLDILGRFVDSSSALERTDGLNHAINLCKESISSDQLHNKEKATLHFFMANAWSGLEKVSTKWAWEQPEIDKQIINLRMAITHDGFSELDTTRQCQILTNLGNKFNFLGRFVEAQFYWDRALEIIPTFGMALANKSDGLFYYGGTLFDEGQKAILYKEAFKYIKKATLASSSPIEFHAKKYVLGFFKKLAALLEPCGPIKSITDLKFSLGRSKKEQLYRSWCLEKRLFLNPLNDLGPHSIAANDVLTAPGIRHEVGEGPFFHGMYDQLKQEYVSARFLFYEGIYTKGRSFSDKGVKLYNTLDYPSYGLNVEKIKITFKACYSIFDKISFFLNEYLKLRILQHKVNFRTLWYKELNRRNGLAFPFLERQNWPLRGLFWLSKDFFEEKDGFRDYLEPEAKDWQKIRNFLEHKYLKLHEDDWALCERDHRASSVWKGNISYSIYRKDFESKTLKLLQLTRAALIYLTLAIYVEETSNEDGSLGQLILKELDTLNDDWMA